MLNRPTLAISILVVGVAGGAAGPAAAPQLDLIICLAFLLCSSGSRRRRRRRERHGAATLVLGRALALTDTGLQAGARTANESRQAGWQGRC